MRPTHFSAGRNRIVPVLLGFLLLSVFAAGGERDIASNVSTTIID
jgi:hypothetical protein